MLEKRDVLNILEKKGCTFKELQQQLSVSEKELYTLLRSLIGEYSILQTKNNHYIAMINSDYRIGSVEKNYNGTAFVRVEDGSVRIAPEFAKELVRGDVVKVKLVSNSPKIGIPEEILTKNNELLTGTVYFKDGRKFIKMDGRKYRRLKIQVPEGSKISEDKKVLFKLGKQYGNRSYDADIIKVLGHVNDPDMDMICRLEKKEIPYTFPVEVKKEVETLPMFVSEKDLKGRKDYRDQLVFTIDGADAKDFDDAVSIHMNEKGNYVLGVHIADVSHYVKENSAIFNEVLRRGTSIYLADRVIPMIPEELSNGICSLKEGVDRLTLSVEMEINSQGNVLDYNIYEGVIRSKKRMKYHEVNKVLDGEMIDGYQDFSTSLHLLKELSTILRRKTFYAGRIDFDREESYVLMHGDEVEDIVLRKRGSAEKLIEEAMIITNKVVATHLYNLNLPSAYRGHYAPDSEDLEKIDRMLEVLGVSLGFSLKECGQDPFVISKALEMCKEFNVYPVISYHMLRAMRKAEYYPTPTGHFGLGVVPSRDEFYTHFTSPIRRENDLIIHKIMKDFVLGHQYSLERIEWYEEQLPLWTTIASVTERRAMDLERDIEQLKKCEYLSHHKGEVFTGLLMDIHESHLTIDVNGLFRVLLPTHTIPEFEMVESNISYKNASGLHYIGEEMSVKINDISIEKGIIYGIEEKSKVLRKETYGNS